MKFLQVTFVLLLINVISFAQEKYFSIEDVVFNSYSSLAPNTLKQLNWIPKTDYISYVKTDEVNEKIVKADISGKFEQSIITLKQLNNIIKLNSLGDTLKRIPLINWKASDSFWFWKDTIRVEYTLYSNELKILNRIYSNASDKFVSSNNEYVAFAKDNNLFLSDTINIVAITNEENGNIISGQSVHRNEFGINSGIFWSPKSNYIAFYQMDESLVTDYPLVQIGTAPAKLKNIKYPMAGQQSHYVKVGIYNILNKKTIWLNTGEPLDQYLTSLTWDPTEKYFYIAHLNRDQNHLRLIKYDVETGEPVKILFEEENEKYVEPENPLFFLPNDSNNFIWFSERDGWQHLYLYDSDGKMIKQLTSGDWEVTDIIGFNAKGNQLFFYATKDSPIERNAYGLDLRNGIIIRITQDPGIHFLLQNEQSELFIDTFSSLVVPSISKIINSESKLVNELNKSEDPIKDFILGEKTIFKIKASDNTDLFCQMIKPVNFDSTKKYPVIVYVYGGPHAQLVTNNWQRGRYDFWFQYMAQKGFLIFTLDNRGSSNRGLKFEQATFRKLGTIEIEDQLKGIEYLSSLNYIDTSRIGVFGWSYGGFMTTSLMLRGGNKFKVGVGGGAVIDWKLYEIMYTERYMDAPLQNPEGYNNANLLNYVQNLNGKLLLVHGTSDPTVVWEHTLMFAQKAANLNKPLDYYPYVGHGHGVGGKDALHLYTKITNYFLDNL